MSGHQSIVCRGVLQYTPTTCGGRTFKVVYYIGVGVIVIKDGKVCSCK